MIQHSLIYYIDDIALFYERKRERERDSEKERERASERKRERERERERERKKGKDRQRERQGESERQRERERERALARTHTHTHTRAHTHMKVGSKGFLCCMLYRCFLHMIQHSFTYYFIYDIDDIALLDMSHRFLEHMTSLSFTRYI